MTIIFYTNAILGRASDLIKRGWTQGKMARDAHGNVTTSVSPNAARFCLVGAVRRAAFDVTGVDVATVDDGSGWFDEPEHRRVAASAYHDAMERVIRAVSESYNARRRRALTETEWNDDPGRKIGEVYALLNTVRVPLGRVHPSVRV